MKKYLLSFAFLILSALCFGQNFPFPMNENGYTYPYGISASKPSNTTIQSKFQAWENAMYTENSSHTLARIKYDDGSYTVSEGIAYGMLIYVYMANSTNTQCRDHFDKLYAYYQEFANYHGFMNWKVRDFSSVTGSGGATDADLDVALALCLAAKQWGSSTNYDYAEEAEKMCAAIYQYEVASKYCKDKTLKVFKPGDGWDNYGNPCYFTVASVGVFKQAQEELKFSSTNTKDWGTVYDDAHHYLEISQKNGVWPNWSSWSGNLGTNNDGEADYFGWDACRVPWRIAWDYVWYGNSSSKSMLSNTIALLKAKSWESAPSEVGFMKGLGGSGYSSIYTSQYAGNVSWTGSIAGAFMTNSSYQSNLDTYYNNIKYTNGSAYYAQTLQVLYMLLLSGNAANFYDCEGGTTPVNPKVTAAETDGSKITLTCSKSMNSSSNYSGFTLFVNGSQKSSAFKSISVSGKTITLTLNNVSLKSGDAISLSYSGTNLTSTENAALDKFTKMSVKNNVPGGNTILSDCNEPTVLTGGAWYTFNDKDNGGKSTVTPTVGSDFTMTSGGANGTSYAAKMTGTLKTGYQYPFVGMGFNLTENEDPYDLSGSTGISFYHKGDAVNLSVKISSVEDYCYHSYPVGSHTNWTLVTVKWDDLKQEDWGAYVNFDESEIFGVQWQFQGSSGASCTVWIDEVTLLGKTITPETVDLSALEAAITTANNLYKSATTDKYPSSAITTFSKAITTATTVRDDTKATQKTIDDATTTLTKAIATFKASAYPDVDKSELKTLIDMATNIYNTTTAGTNVGQYSPTMRTKLESAISSANSVYNNASASASSVSAQISALKTAYNNYMASKVTETAIDDVEYALTVYPNPCSNVLNIEANKEITSIKIIAVNGTKTIFDGGQSNIQLNVVNLANGFYTVQILFADNTITTANFIKK